MTDEEILEKAFEKVKKNGLKLYSLVPKLVLKYSNIETVIFSHKFAKAFWGDDELDNRGRTLIKAWEEEWRDSGHFTDFEEYVSEPEIYYQIAWEYHLQRMVLEKEPLKYLEKFL